jgi:hypothetical protein
VATRFLDTFTGGVGNLVGHVPDTTPAGEAWATLTGDWKLDGAGKAIADSAGSPGYDRVVFSSNMNVSTGFEFSASLFLLVTTVDATTTLLVDPGGLYICQLRLQGLGGSVVAQAFIHETAGDAHTFANVPVSASQHDLKVVFSGVTAKFYVDGVLEETASITAPKANAKQVWIHTLANANFGFDRMEILDVAAGPPPPPPVFWTNFVKTFEVP